MPTALRPAPLRGTVLGLAALFALIGCPTVSNAQDGSDKPVRITVITDLDDDLYDAHSGSGGVDATRMAVEDFGGRVLGRPVVVDARNDHNKPDRAKALAEGAFGRRPDAAW